MQRRRCDSHLPLLFWLLVPLSGVATSPLRFNEDDDDDDDYCSQRSEQGLTDAGGSSVAGCSSVAPRLGQAATGPARSPLVLREARIQEPTSR
jgi:hypothetical protein